MAFICLLIAGVIAYMGYLETRVNTPFDAQKVCTVRRNLINGSAYRLLPLHRINANIFL